MSNSTESPFSLTLKVGKNNDLLTGRAGTIEEMVARVGDLLALQEFICNAGDPTPQVNPDVAHAVQNLTAQIPATIVAAPPAPSVPHPAAQAGPRVVKHPTWENCYFVYDHPEAIRMPDGGLAIMKHAKSQGGKVYQRWQHPVTGPEDPGNGKTPPWDGDFVDRAVNRSMLPAM